MCKSDNFSNIIKYDINKCDKCLICVNICKNQALEFNQEKLVFKNEQCIACKKCIINCPTNALYYNVNVANSVDHNTTAVIPYNADLNFLPFEYQEVITNLIGEKIKVIETAFEMEKASSNKILGEVGNPIIISDIENLHLILKNTLLINYLSLIKPSYYLTSYIYRMKKMNKNIVLDFYGIPFESKLTYYNSKMIDHICDIPYRMSHYYSPLDVLNTYINLCELRPTLEEKFTLSKPICLTLNNKYLTVKILLTNSIEYLMNINYKEYDFIFLLKNNSYMIRENLLKDLEINELYKKKLKAPLKTTAFFRRR